MVNYNHRKTQTSLSTLKGKRKHLDKIRIRPQAGRYTMTKRFVKMNMIVAALAVVFYAMEIVVFY